MTKKTGTAAFNMPMDFMPMDFTNLYKTNAFENIQESSAEMASFVTKRLQEDMALSQKLVSCKQPMDMMDVWADYYKTAFSDYSEHSKKVFGLIERAADGSQATAKDIVEAGKAVQ